jgi:hypothetical protein
VGDCSIIKRVKISKPQDPQDLQDTSNGDWRHSRQFQAKISRLEDPQVIKMPQDKDLSGTLLKSQGFKTPQDVKTQPAQERWHSRRFKLKTSRLEDSRRYVPNSGALFLFPGKGETIALSSCSLAVGPGLNTRAFGFTYRLRASTKCTLKISSFFIVFFVFDKGRLLTVFYQ